MKRPLAKVLAAALALTPATPSFAQPKPPSQKNLAEARRHYERGEALFAARKYEEAVVEYAAAYDLSYRPLFLFNMAQAHRLRGARPEAVKLYEAYLAEDPQGPAAADSQAFLATLRVDLEREALVRRQTADEHWRGTVEGASPAPLPVAASVTPVPDVTPERDTGSGRGLRIGGLAAGGSGVALLGVGVYFWLRSRSLDADQDGATRFDQGLVDDGHAANRNATIFLSVGGAAVITGGILLYLGTRGGREARVSVAPALAPGLVGIGVQARL